jgi:hypothetical protein
MIKRLAIAFALVYFASANISPANVFGVILKGLAKEAVKSAGAEAGKTAVDRFNTLFNGNKDIARNYKGPQLRESEARGSEKNWLISPAGTLRKDDIAEIARTLKSLDQGRDQGIRVKIGKDDLTVTTTQTGVTIQSVTIQGSGNITSTAQGGTGRNLSIAQGGTGNTLNLSVTETPDELIKGAYSDISKQ